MFLGGTYIRVDGPEGNFFQKIWSLPDFISEIMVKIFTYLRYNGLVRKPDPLRYAKFLYILEHIAWKIKFFVYWAPLKLFWKAFLNTWADQKESYLRTTSSPGTFPSTKFPWPQKNDLIFSQRKWFWPERTVFLKTIVLIGPYLPHRKYSDVTISDNVVSVKAPASSPRKWLWLDIIWERMLSTLKTFISDKMVLT